MIRMYYYISIVIMMVIISTIVEIDAKQLRGMPTSNSNNKNNNKNHHLLHQYYKSKQQQQQHRRPSSIALLDVNQLSNIHHRTRVGKLPNDQRVHIVGVQGGVEGFSLLLRTFLTLAPETFKVKEDMETDDQRKKSENLIQSVQNLFVNMVVVGALLMSITGPMVMETPTAGIKTLNLFGETVVFWIELIYMFMISVSFVTSAILTYATMRFYTHLTFWLITPGSRVKYIEHSAPVAYIVLSSMFSFGTMMVAIGLGSVITDCYKAIPVTVVLLAFFYHCFWLEISNKAPGQMAAALLMRDVVDTFNGEGGENDN